MSISLLSQIHDVRQLSCLSCDLSLCGLWEHLLCLRSCFKSQFNKATVNPILAESHFINTVIPSIRIILMHKVLQLLQIGIHGKALQLHSVPADVNCPLLPINIDTDIKILTVKIALVGLMTHKSSLLLDVNGVLTIKV